jgi:hypothetical protein
MTWSPTDAIKRICARIRVIHESLNRTRQITRLYELRAIAVRCGAGDVTAALDQEINRVASGALNSRHSTLSSARGGAA